MEIKNITVIGGGNIGTLLAADLKSYNDFKITMFTSDRDTWSDTIVVLDGDEKVKKEVTLDLITDDVNEAFKDADMIISTLPSDAYHKMLPQYIDKIPSDCLFGVMPGMGGKEFLFINNKNYFAFQRVPGVSRLKKYGESVYDLGKRDHLFIGSFDKSFSEKLCKFFTPVFGIKCSPVDNLLAITLTPSNPILHTSRLYRLGQMVPLKSEVLFYNEWDDESSRIIIAMDEEVQKLVKKINRINLESVVSLKKHYESETIEEFTNKLTSIESLKNIESPLIEINGKFHLDLTSRYFTEDFVYGLAVIKSFGIIAESPMPTIDRVLEWQSSIEENKYFENGEFTRKLENLPHYDLSLDDIYRIYK